MLIMVLEEFCPHCNVKNYIDLGEMSTDLTSPDVSGFICYSCKKQSYLKSIREYIIEHCDDWEIEFITDGLIVDGSKYLK